MSVLASILLTIIFQLLVIFLVFLGFLLDPLMGVWIVAIYFFVIGSFLTYYFFSHIPIFKKKDQIR